MTTRRGGSLSAVIPAVNNHDAYRILMADLPGSLADEDVTISSNIWTRSSGPRELVYASEDGNTPECAREYQTYGTSVGSGAR